MSSIQRLVGFAFIVSAASLMGCDVSYEPAGALDPSTNINVSMETMEDPCPNPAPDGTCPHNGLTPACFWSADVQLTLRSLQNARLVNVNGTLATTPNLSYSSTGDGCREMILKDLVACALPMEATAYDAASGLTFYGYFGLGTSWQVGAMASAEKPWVTACLAQHINGLGAKVPIMLSGDNTKFADNMEGSANFPMVESTAYGNLFDSTVPIGPGLSSGPAFTLYVCSEDDRIWDGCDFTDPGDYIDHRVCDTVGSMCGLSYLGACSTACTASTQSNGFWVCNGDKETVTASVPNACYW